MNRRSHVFNRWARNALLAACWAGIGTVAIAQTATPPATTQPPTGAESSAAGRVALEAAFTRADANNDGMLSREEAQRLPAIAERFDELDKNKDGVLSFDEFAAGATTDVATDPK